ncbi:MAG: hypothetical protein GC131_03770 [Alphaproteobacteria bacterium]|nr:hypothetical protein [Alphaproteobacteria bacterium]
MSKPTNYNKFTNLHLTHGHVLTHKAGGFSAIVRLARPEYRPEYMTILGTFTPGWMRARINCDALDRAADDSDVLSVELCEHYSVAPLH